MKSTLRTLSTALLCAILTCGAALAQIQSSSSGAAQPSASLAAVGASPVPSLVNYSGVLKDSGGKPATSLTGVTFLLYKDSQGGAPVWMETQNVMPDKTGHYTAQLGSTSSAGLPSEVFMTGEARWLGVQMAGETEQPRVLLVAVPYAMKAGDAATIGGLPPSAFVLATPGVAASARTANAVAAQTASPATATNVTTTGGTVNYLPLFNGTSTIVDSVLFQSATAPFKIGINTTTPASTLDVKGSGTIRGILSLPVTGTATATAGKSSQPLSLAASAYNSSTPAAVNQTFRWQAEPAGNNTATPSGTLNLLFGEGIATPTETGLHIASDGQIAFAAGQTFPGVVQLDAANTFIGNQTVDGIFSASSNAFGVTGAATTTTGIGVGVAGTAATPSGYGVEGLNNATSGGVGVYGSSAAASGYGVEGVNTSGNGTGVYGTAGHFGVQGIATATSGSTVGVYGSGVDGLQGSGTVHGVYAAGTGAGSMGVYGTSPVYGLYGVATNTTGTSFGVYGSGGSNGVYGIASNFGLYGVATATSGNSVGVYGNGVDGLQGSGSTYGVYAAGTGASATGVYGTTATSSGYGVEGVNTSSSGAGVYGTAGRFGLYGVATGTSDTVGVFGSGVDGLQGGGTIHGVYANGGQYGVYSLTSAGIAGTYGVYGAPSVTGATDFISPGAAVWADTNRANGGPDNIFALLATADNNLAGVFFNNSGQSPTIDLYNQGGGGTGDVIHAEGAGGSCTLTGGGDAACTGVLKSVVATNDTAGAQRVETYSVQSAENWFEDAGTGQLVSGTGRVNLESIFGQTVNTGVEYHVFLTPDGDCKGLYVSAKSASSFEVRELGGGASSIAFEYRIMAKRAGYENVRLANVTERYKRQQEQAKKMQRPARAPVQTQPSFKMPLLQSTATGSAPTLLVAPRPIAPMPVLAKAVPLPHPAAPASKPEVTHK